MAERVLVHIDTIAAGGAGVGRVDGMAVFVPRTAPGDDASVALRRHRRYADGRLQHLVQAGPTRVTPLCPHYTRDRCGGCQLQHLSPAGQLEAKTNIVVQAFRRIGRRVVTVDRVVPSPALWRYRNKLTLTLRHGAGGWHAGLRPFDAPDDVFALDDCHITSEQVMRGWREVMAAQTLLPIAPELRGTMGEAGARNALLLYGGSRWDDRAEFAAQCPSLTAIHWEDASGRTVVVRDDRPDEASIASFAQVNPHLADALHDHVAACVLADAPQHVIDAYGGRGATAARLLAPGRSVTLIELDPEAARHAQRALGADARVVLARVEDALPGLLPADAVILNPPRAGVDARVCEALEQTSHKPQTLVYVSCDPATLARDVSRLTSYRVVSLTLFDMFPQTAHVETVCELVPEVA